jgi:hypothetical protein
VQQIGWNEIMPAAMKKIDTGTLRGAPTTQYIVALPRSDPQRIEICALLPATEAWPMASPATTRTMHGKYLPAGPEDWIADGALACQNLVFERQVRSPH